jgi:hypothetical protein
MGFEAPRRRSSHAVALDGADEPRARIDTMMRGSMRMPTGRPMTESSSRVSSPSSAVMVARVASGMRPVWPGCVVMGMARATRVGAGASAAL